MPEKADAHPTKEFFVKMITKDIQLDACILDLLDNCLDGANSVIANKNGQTETRYEGFWAEITISQNEFKITDNCGGISIEEAKGYAFRFGRRPDAPPEAEYSIGLYGIGMKRAVFKMGKNIDIESSTSTEAFGVLINVDEWLGRTSDWDFDLEPKDALETPGTTIQINDLHEEIQSEFNDPVFVNKLRSSIARDYSIFLQNGFTVKVNDSRVVPYEFKLRESDQFIPVKQEYDDDSIHVEITAGMAGLPSDDSSAESPENSIPEVEYYGWFVLCNDRVVIAADKSSATVWGDEQFPVWHPQYNSFMGIASFRSERADLLPWTTTKRDIDLNDATYRRAVRIMKEVTRQYIDYTTQRKADLEAAKALERNTRLVPIVDVTPSIRMVLPRLPRADVVNISYQKPRQKVMKAAEALGNRAMPYKQVGSEAFDYFYERKVQSPKSPMGPQRKSSKLAVAAVTLARDH
ncbi:MAG: ATP-binding protein [Pyrinomonadaceae bacterium]